MYTPVRSDVSNDDIGISRLELGTENHQNLEAEMDIEKSKIDDFPESDVCNGNSLLYSVDESPPLLTAIILAFQNLLVSFGGCIVVGLVIADLGCAGPEHPIRTKIFCSSLFMVGVTTAVQSSFGIRLPVLQGASSAFLVPLVTLKSSGVWTCPEMQNRIAEENTTNGMSFNGSSVFDQDDILYSRIRELQGSLMLGAATEALIGCTGLIGFLLRFIRPISISVTITLVGLSIAPIPVRYCNAHWPIAIVTIAAMIVFSTYLSSVKIPFPSFRRTSKANKIQRFPIFQLFSFLMAMCCGWLICFVLTITNVLPDDPNDAAFFARTDANLDIVKMSPWISLTYPGQFGMPSFNLAVFLGYVAVFVASEIESVGDYMAVSGVCQMFPPPNHAVNRGIMCEGLLGLVSGAVGIGHATTSYTANIAIIKYTKVASRSVMILAGVIAIILSVIGKFGAGMSLIPYPALGGVYLVVCGTITAVGVANLRNVDMTSSRNIVVFGVSVYIGFIFSEWLKMFPGRIKTGTLQLDQVLKIFLGTPMFLGTLVALFLDNTIPDKQRQHKANKTEDKGNEPIHFKVYEFEWITPLQRRIPILRRIPFLQPYRGQ